MRRAAQLLRRTAPYALTGTAVAACDDDKFTVERVNVIKIPHLKDQGFPGANKSNVAAFGYAKFVSDEDCVLGDIVLNGPSHTTKAYTRAGPREKLHFDPQDTRCAIVTCGGLCPGLNTVVKNLVEILESISASRRVEAPSLHSNDSWPSHDDVGGFFFDFGAVRTVMLRAGPDTGWRRFTVSKVAIAASRVSDGTRLWNSRRTASRIYTGRAVLYWVRLAADSTPRRSWSGCERSVSINCTSSAGTGPTAAPTSSRNCAGRRASTFPSLVFQRRSTTTLARDAASSLNFKVTW